MEFQELEVLWGIAVLLWAFSLYGFKKVTGSSSPPGVLTWIASVGFTVESFFIFGWHALWVWPVGVFLASFTTPFLFDFIFHQIHEKAAVVCAGLSLWASVGCVILIGYKLFG